MSSTKDFNPYIPLESKNAYRFRNYTSGHGGQQKGYCKNGTRISMTFSSKNGISIDEHISTS
jgi:hypothetical protein